MIKSLTLHGLRGFADEQTIDFAMPSAQSHGLTMIVGSNNTGKSTVFEGLKIFSAYPQMVGEGVRSTATNRALRLILEIETGVRITLSNPDGGAQLTFNNPGADLLMAQNAKIIAVPSRRTINSQHSVGSVADVGSAFARHLDVTRQSHTNTAVEMALAEIAQNAQKKARLNALISEITGTTFDWTTEINASNHAYFKFRFATGDHSLEGLGEGVISLIVMLLPFVEQRFPIITIDEPELSLHPAWQKRLFAKLVELSRTTQIIIATHSPHFVDIGLIKQGAKIYRTYKNRDGRARLAGLSLAAVQDFGDAMNNSNNPHTLGYEMREALFLEDRIIVAEGQEDVLALRRAAEQINTPLTGNLLGWGAGSASMITKICKLLSDLGYSEVVGVFDANEVRALEQARRDHPHYQFVAIPCDDIRDKPAQNSAEKVGLLDTAMRIKPGTDGEVAGMIRGINAALDQSPAQSA